MLVHSQLDEENRIISVVILEEFIQPDSIEIEVPDDTDIYTLFNYKYIDGELIFDPIQDEDPDPETPSLDDRVSSIEEQMNALTSAFEVSEVTNA